MLNICETGSAGTIKNTVFFIEGCVLFAMSTYLPNGSKNVANRLLKWSWNRYNRVFNTSWTVPETTMKIKVENVRTWEPKGSLNGHQNHLKIDEKTDLVTASAAKAHFGVPGSIWGYPPWRKRLQEHTKKRLQKYQNTWTNFSKKIFWKAPSSAKSPGARRSGRSPPG